MTILTSCINLVKVRFYLHLVDILASPLTPLQPEAFFKSELMLAGEGSIRERGAKPPSQNLSPSVVLFEGRLRGAKSLFFLSPPLQTCSTLMANNHQFGEGD
jgi:hypothetical protein